MKRNSFVVALSVALSATLSVGFVNVTPKVIYGEDDRLDVYQVERSDIREIADSTVALIGVSKMKNLGALYSIETTTFGSSMNLCSSEPYYNQPNPANCSGFLVGDDLIATAGHCVSSDEECKRYHFVFNYKMIDANTIPATVSASDVYSCRAIVAREYQSEQDYALIRLDRPVQGHRVLSLAQTPAQPGDALYVVGHPSGLPTKVAGGAHVRSQKGAYFQADLDTYGGNSGSAVFNAATHEVVGILVRGAQDYKYDNNLRCRVSNVCTQDGCRGEDVTNISYISSAIEK